MTETTPRKTLVLDSNLIVLYVVGALDKNLLRRHRRTQAYVPEDFELLLDIMAKFSEVATTPNCLTEASNLLRHGHSKEQLMGVLAGFIGESREEYVRSSTVVGGSQFSRLGLADCALANAFTTHACFLTDDFGLYLYLHNRGLLQSTSTTSERGHGRGARNGW